MQTIEGELRKLLVHIGCAKGGSSAIQKGLRINHEALASKGISVPAHDLRPGSHVSGSHGDFFEAFLQDRRAMEIPDLGDLLDAQADACGASTVVLSAENLSNPTGFERVFEKLADRFDISVLFYARRQDEYLASAWQQWYIKRGDSLLLWMIHCIRFMVGDWHATLQPWADALGDERMVARVYDRDRLVEQDVFMDFLEVLGEDAAGLEGPGETYPSLSPMLSRVVEGRGYLFDGPNDQAFYRSVRELAPDLVRKRGDEPGIFSPDEANAIMVAFRQSNERFRKRYLPHIKRPLFPMRPGGKATTGVDKDAFERELLQVQVFNLHKQLDEVRASLKQLGESLAPRDKE